MDLKEIAQDLNLHASGYSIGSLQSLRKEIKGKKRLPLGGLAIFHESTIDSAGDWAFHYGGRSELQFNIGLEKIENEECLRFGVAFSLEPSQTLPDVTILYPRIKRFNDYVSLYSHDFQGFYTWYWNKERSGLFVEKKIQLEYVGQGWFIFFGKYINKEDYSPHTVLKAFDELLPLYEFVEGRENSSPFQVIGQPGFSFVAGSFTRLMTTHYTRERLSIDVDLRHMAIQGVLFERLCLEHGAENVAPERSSGVGTRVDIVVRVKDEFWFYEVKTGSTARACIREAIGQLLEYSYWPGAQQAARLIVVGQPALDSQGIAYLSDLRARFAMPIEYLQQVVPCL